MNLLGVDVGFSATALTTGLAWRIGGEIGVTKTGTPWALRGAALPPGITFSVAALDAPILPGHEGQPTHRGCESIFYGGKFWNRCRPGLSHYGRGLALRRAGGESALQFALVVSGLKLTPDLEVRRDCALIEAFPNAFLGVLLPEDVYENSDRRKNEHKSDWMYRKTSDQGTIARLLAELGWIEKSTIKLFMNEGQRNGDHELRAALVCLLTAGFAVLGNAVVVGDAARGWFWLPPMTFWQPWASSALHQQIQRVRGEKFPRVDLWSKPFFKSAPAP